MDKTPCNQTFKLLGDYWTLRIISSLGKSEIRFCELQRQVDNLNPVTLTNRLKKLEASKIVDRVDLSNDGSCVCYKLSQLGLEVLPVIKSLNKLAAKFEQPIKA